MLKVAVIANGSRGDVQPYIALGKGLKTAGYDVCLLTNDDFEGLATEAGLKFGSLGQGVEALLQTDEWRKTTESGNFLKILLKMQSEMKGQAGKIAARMPALVKGNDLIVGGTGILSAYPVAQKYNIPVIQAYVFPFSPTREFPGALTPNLPFGNALNRFSFQILRQALWQSSKMVDKSVRQQLGLPKGSFWGPFRSLAENRVPVLYGYSQHVLPRPADWAENELVTGYWFLDEPDAWTPPADLVDFLNAGAPPVYIGFGSMGSRNPEAAGKIALEALARTGQRGILATGWGGLKSADLPPTVHLISSIPHSWLFPRMAAVVHHGGAGTTAAGLRAGVPNVVVPFMADQPFWGQQVVKLGVGTQPIPRKKLNAENLADAIRETVENSEMRQNAAELGQKIRAENGIGAAVAFVDRFCERLAVATK
jgi:sterol 3beta-glucosyltransferase